jgi:DNA invertase Pin-like site-specific DNA recombinase
MAKNRRRDIVPETGWAIYLRTSDADVQNPKNSHERQREAIYRILIEPSAIPVFKEYCEVGSGRKRNRKMYQAMLEDARNGRFSHLAIQKTGRFGRDSVEAMRALRQLVDMGIEVRIAENPQADVTNYNDQFMIGINMLIDENESFRIGERTRGGLHAKMRAGGFVGKAPMVISMSR